MNSYTGTRALLGLVRLRSAARLRRLRGNLKRPKTLALALLGVVFVAALVASQMLGDRAGHDTFSAFPKVPLLSFFLTVFLVTTVLGAVRQGVMAFSPAEVHFLLPAPVGSRALILAHLLNASLKVLFSSAIFAIFLSPGGGSRLRSLGGYFTIFVVLVALGLVLDLAHGRLPAAARRRRARRLGVALLLVAVAVAALRLPAPDGDVLSALAPLGWPAWPFVQLLVGDDPSQVALGGALAVGALVALLVTAFVMPADVRETARGTSEVVQKRLRQLGTGQWLRDRADGKSRRSLVPMLPRLGGAGPHLRRQLITLSRTRRGLAMLLWMTAVTMGSSIVAGGDALPAEAVAAMGVVMPMLMGSMFLQCDFRGDFGSLAWLRSLPCSATALAAGQMIAGTLVCFALQLVFVAWALIDAPAESVPWILGAVPLLPALVLLQFCVENGAYLIAPQAMPGSNGQPPGAGQLLRFYGLTLLKFAVLVVALLPPAAAGGLVAWWSDEPALGLLVGGAVLWLEAALAVALVGRIFLSVDPGRDLARD